MIGRADEAEAIARFLDDVPNGPIGLLIQGEPGIGKTTLWLEAIRAAAEHGHLVLAARPSEAEADLSFAALADLVGGVLDEVSRALPGPQRLALEVALLRRDADAPADPLTTATALVTALGVLGRRAPLVIAIDDAQWLDGASRRAVEYAIRRLPPRSGLLVASRLGEGGALPLGLDRALGPGRLEHRVLAPLSLAALSDLVRSRLGRQLPRPILVRIAEASSGNPFYALEIARAMAHDGFTIALGDPLPVPGTLRGILTDRLERLSPAAHAAASAAAALSHPTAATVALALGPDVDAETALLDAEEAGVLASDGDRLRFSHPLLASTIYGSLAGARRRALHRRLAGLVVDPEEAARHLARSATAASAQVAGRVEEAAELAVRRGAPEAAAELFDAACRLTPADAVEDLARRMLGGAHALSRAGDLSGARTLANRALETAPGGSLRARALLLLGRLARYIDTFDGGLDEMERALREAGDDEVLRIEILLALFEEIAVDTERAAQRAAEAVELLRGRDDPARLALALAHQFVIDALLGHGADVRLLDEAVALGTRSLYPLIWFHWIDDLEATRAQYALRERDFRESGDVGGAAELVEFLAMTEFRAGNWATAEDLLEDACDTLAQFELRGPFVASFADRAVIDAHRGRLERARRTLMDILDGIDRLEPFWRMVGHSAQGAVEFCAGDHQAADRAWTAMRDGARVIGWIDFLEDRSEPDHAEALVVLGRLDDARAVLDHLEWRGRTLPRRWIEAGLPRARALIVAAEGDLAGALAVLDAAPEVPALPFERARTLLVRGQIERRANQKVAARDSLSAALAAFESLGSPPWAARARTEIGRIGLRHRSSDELTDGERRIAELAAAGMTNRQVADAAFVSPKTVEANLARVYQKLGIRSRAELGARMSAASRDPDPNP
jgi:DNA-binding CsgD family transcriptional regulator